MTDLRDIEKRVQSGESESVEFKKSTAQLARAGQTLGAFLNGMGGRVLIGVTPRGRIEGQFVSDTTLQDVAAVIDKIEPVVPVSQEVVPDDIKSPIRVAYERHNRDLDPQLVWREKTSRTGLIWSCRRRRCTSRRRSIQKY